MADNGNITKDQDAWYSWAAQHNEAAITSELQDCFKTMEKIRIFLEKNECPNKGLVKKFRTLEDGIAEAGVELRDTFRGR